MATPRKSQSHKDIIAAQDARGWLVDTADQYYSELALNPADVLGFMRESPTEP